MTSILPQIEALENIPLLHYQYAKGLLQLLVSELLEIEEFEIGLYSEGKKWGSQIIFDSDEFENSQLELRYVTNEDRFYIIASDDSEDIDTSTFRYKIHDGMSLYDMIPHKLVAMMKQAAFDRESILFNPKTIKNGNT